MDKNCVTLNLEPHEASRVIVALLEAEERSWRFDCKADEIEYRRLRFVVHAAFDEYERHEQGEPATKAELIQDNEWSASDRLHQLAREIV